MYKLAKAAEEAFQKLNLRKMALLEAGLDELGEWPERKLGRPLRFRNTKHVGEVDVACLFTDEVEAEIWASIEMAEDFPSSCTFYVRGAVNRAGLPMVMIDPRRQPKTNQTEDDAGRARMEEETQLRERIRIRALVWPAASVVWTLGLFLRICRSARRERQRRRHRPPLRW